MGHAIRELGSLGSQARDDDTREVLRMERAACDVMRAVHRCERMRRSDSRRAVLLKLARTVRRLTITMLGANAEQRVVRELSYGIALLLLQRTMQHRMEKGKEDEQKVLVDR